MTETDARPEPEALLAEAAKEGRGRLKVFLGPCLDVLGYAGGRW
jgi:K+-sensing histidine kinase KdpD